MSMGLFLGFRGARSRPQIFTTNASFPESGTGLDKPALGATGTSPTDFHAGPPADRNTDHRGDICAEALGVLHGKPCVGTLGPGLLVGPCFLLATNNESIPSRFFIFERPFEAIPRLADAAACFVFAMGFDMSPWLRTADVPFLFTIGLAAGTCCAAAGDLAFASPRPSSISCKICVAA